jgi:GNAT superfamily N-acetyltransferase
MLTFESIAQHKPGILASLLTESYGELLSSGEHFWQLEKASWIGFDEDVFDNPTSVGQCVFLTRLNTDVVGFSSFDPRRGPSFGIIGHNCIRPRFRGQGFGKDQIRETLRRMEMRSIKRVVVSTSEHPFFIPAQRMYLSLGFKESKRYPGHPHLGYQTIEYELDLCRNTQSS